MTVDNVPLLAKIYGLVFVKRGNIRPSNGKIKIWVWATSELARVTPGGSDKPTPAMDGIIFWVVLWGELG